MANAVAARETVETHLQLSLDDAVAARAEMKAAKQQQQRHHHTDDQQTQQLLFGKNQADHQETQQLLFAKNQPDNQETQQLLFGKELGGGVQEHTQGQELAQQMASLQVCGVGNA